MTARKTPTSLLSFGAMEYLGEDGAVLRRDTPASLHEIYLRYCEANGLTPLELQG